MLLALPQYNSIFFANIHLKISSPALLPQGLTYMKLIKMPQGHSSPTESLPPYPVEQILFTAPWGQQFITDFSLKSHSPTQSFYLKPDSEPALPTHYQYQASRAQKHYLATGFLNLTVNHPTLKFCSPPCLKYFEASPSLLIWAKSPFSLLENSPAECLTCT